MLLLPHFLGADEHPPPMTEPQAPLALTPQKMTRSGHVNKNMTLPPLHSRPRMRDRGKRASHFHAEDKHPLFQFSSPSVLRVRLRPGKNDLVFNGCYRCW